MRQRLAFTIALFWALLGLAAPPAVAQSVLRDDFEGPEASLRDAGGDASYKIDGPQRISQGTHSGRSCERLTVRGNNGTYVYVSHPLLTARVISELVPSIWLKADRPGLQLLARVTLPRSIDPRNGKPLVTLVRGSAYSQVGSWQQLRVDNLPQSLERQVRVLRTQFGRDVDARSVCRSHFDQRLRRAGRDQRVGRRLRNRGGRVSAGGRPRGRSVRDAQRPDSIDARHIDGLARRRERAGGRS